MRTPIVPIVALAAILAACGGKTHQDAPFAIDSLRYEKASGGADVVIAVDYPISGSAVLTNAVGEYISEHLGGTYAGSLSNGDSLLAYYGQSIFGGLQAEAQMQGEDQGMAYSSNHEMRLMAETGAYVTYSVNSYVYFGGAHGMPYSGGVTFRKSDGRRVAFDMLRGTGSEEFRSLIKEGLRQYFTSNGIDVSTDDQLMDMLLTGASIDYLPLPTTQPYLMPQGMVLTYQPYEIAPYAAGMPQFTISYDHLQPFMTHTLSLLAGGQPAQ